MNPDSFEEAVNQICVRDDRFRPEAYYFLRNALDVTVMVLGRSKDGRPQHVTGRELALGIRDFANAEYGPLAYLVLSEWGLSSTSDFGEMVYNLIEVGVLGKNAKDRREDFDGVYNFEDAFVLPYQPDQL